MRAFGNVDRHLSAFRLVRLRRGRDLHRAEQAGLDQRAARLLDLGRIVSLATPPAQPALDIAGIEGFQSPDRNAAKAHRRAGRELIGHLHRVVAVVDHDLPVVNFGKGVAAGAKRAHQRRLRRHHRGGARRVAGLQRQRPGSRRERQRLTVGAEHRDRGDVVERSRHDLDRDLLRLRGGIDVVIELGIPIAKAACGVGEPAEITVGAAAQALPRRPADDSRASSARKLCLTDRRDRCRRRR